jgi:hypothetical protein
MPDGTNNITLACWPEVLAQHQITAAAYLVRDYAVLRYLPLLWRL